MKSLSFLLALFSFLLLFMQSCTIEKRHYTSGYHVEWNHRNKTIKNHESTSDRVNTKTTVLVIENQELMASANEDVALIKSVEVIKEIQEESALAEDSSPNTSIKIDSDVRQSDKFVPAGDQDVKTEVAESLVSDSHQKSDLSQNRNASSTAGSAGGGKSQIVALLLCFFLGLLGIHRFYLGYTGMGILYLLTLGLLGIGWLIDFILLIIPNGLTPKGKTSYKE